MSDKFLFFHFHFFPLPPLHLYTLFSTYIYVKCLSITYDHKVNITVWKTGTIELLLISLIVIDSSKEVLNMQILSLRLKS